MASTFAGKSRGVPLSIFGIILALVLAVGLGAGLLMRRGRAAPPSRVATPPKRKTTASSRVFTSRPGSPGAVPGAPPGSPGAAHGSPGGPPAPPKWAPVPGGPQSLAEMVDRLREAVRGNKVGTMNDLQSLINQYVAGDPEHAREILELFRKETDASVLEILTGALQGDPQIAGDPAMVQNILAMAREDENPDRRAQALAFLGNAQEVTPQLVGDVVALARASTDPRVKTQGLSTLAQFMQGHPELGPQINDTFLEVARSDADPVVRRTAMESLDLNRAGPQAADAVAQLLRSDPSPDLRSMAALKLADGPPQQRCAAMAQMEEVFVKDQDPQLRAALIENVVRAGRRDALASLKRMDAADPTRHQQIQDYVEILGAGFVDMSDIDREMQRRMESRGVGEAGRPPPEDEPPPGEPRK